MAARSFWKIRTAASPSLPLFICIISRAGFVLYCGIALRMSSNFGEPPAGAWIGGLACLGFLAGRASRSILPSGTDKMRPNASDISTSALASKPAWVKLEAICSLVIRSSLGRGTITPFLPHVDFSGPCPSVSWFSSLNPLRISSWTFSAGANARPALTSPYIFINA